MVDWGCGLIVNICLIQSDLVWLMIGFYIVVKGGLCNFICVMMVEWVGFGVCVNVFVLGYLYIEMMQVFVDDFEFDCWVCGCILVGCWGDFVDLIGVVVFFFFDVLCFVIG